MAQLNTDLETIKTARDNMKTALEGQGQTVTKDIRTYAQAIANISGGSGDVKLFDTIEHMQEDENPQDGDLAVVYREELQPVTEESEFDSCVFPNEVVLDEAFTGSISGSFRSTDGGFFDGMVNMSSSSFRFDGFGDEMIRVEYTSQDGITYTRTDGGEELQEFGTTIKWNDGMGSFNTVIGNFMKIGGNYFGGMYEYGNYLDSNYHSSFININSIIKDGNYFVASNGKFILDLYNIRRVRPYVVLQKFSGTFHGVDYCEMIEAYELSDSENWNGPSRVHPSGVIIAKDLSTNKFTLFYVKHSTDEQHPDIQSIKIGHYSNNTLIEEDKNVSYYGVSTYSSGGKFYFYKIDGITEVVYVDDIYFSYSGNGSLDFNVWQYYSTTDAINETQFLGSLKFDSGINYNKYNLISSQLDATPDYVYEKTFYGKNGVEDGTLTTNVSNLFNDVNAEVVCKIQQVYENMQQVVLTDQDIPLDRSIYFIPTKLDGTSLFDTSNMTNMYCMFNECANLITITDLDTSSVTNMSSMFNGCKKLKNIPLLDTSSVTNMNNMFDGCSSLESLPNLDTSNVTTMTSFVRGTKITTLPNLNTSNVTTLYWSFANCSYLTTFPNLDVARVTEISNFCKNCTNLTTFPELNLTSTCTQVTDAFANCPNLSDNSLNNIMATLKKTAPTMSDYKTLAYVGLSETQANKCKTLSNWSAFYSAGWTTGY